MPEVKQEQRYGPTAGTVSGWFGLAACVLFAAMLLADGHDAATLAWVFGLAALGVVLWCFMLRPRIVLRHRESLELRNPFSSWVIPIAEIDVVNVRAVTRVTAGERRYDGVAVGRSLREMRRDARGYQPEVRSNRVDASTPSALADLMTEQVLVAAAAARRDGFGAGDPRRTWAAVELVGLGALLAATIVCVLIQL